MLKYKINHRDLSFLCVKTLFLLFLIQIVSFAQQTKYELYGYSQIDFSASSQQGTKSGFSQRRLNLIGEYFLDKNIRVLNDIEYENGTDISPSDSNSTGVIKVSRMWIEYSVAPQLKIRAGKMFTPFGLYNLIHDASASYFPVDPPIMYSSLKLFNGLPAQRLFAKYYTGIELLGIFEIDSEGGQIEYSAGIGNGRGISKFGEDLNNNRSLSFRAMYRPSFLEGLQFGTSYYLDRNYYGIGGVKNDDEYSAGLDIQYENDNLQLQTEGLISSYKLLSGKKDLITVGYLQAAYTFYDVLTPFVNYTVISNNIKSNEVSFSRLNFGINWAVSINLFLKSEIQFHESEEEHSDKSFEVFKLSAAIAF